MAGKCTARKQKNYDQETMEKVLEMYKKHDVGFLRAAKMYNVPRTTLFRLFKANSPADTKLGRKFVLPPELEQLKAKREFKKVENTPICLCFLPAIIKFYF